MTNEPTILQTAVLVGVGTSQHTIEQGLDELALLADTAGAEEATRLTQVRDTPDPATYVGSGKIQEIKDAVTIHKADLVIVDNDLSPAQQRNMERAIGVLVIDRTGLILDIFAQHANTQEGRTQVELAQLRYQLPRLRNTGPALAQQGAGIGTRGPGETQLETDRRRLTRRMTTLERALRDLEANRRTQRKARRQGNTPSISLAGYTSAGKSTLLNQLTGAGVHTNRQLFSTLDPTTRKLALPGGEEVTISDTVGFVRSLPHQLVAAFRSTLDETIDADLILHVADASDPNLKDQLDAVHTVLEDIGAAGVDQFLILNKADLLDTTERERLLNQHPGAVLISAQTGEGIEDLLTTMHEHLHAGEDEIHVLIPHDRGDLVATLHRKGSVLSEEHHAEGTRLHVRIDPSIRHQVSTYETH